MRRIGLVLGLVALLALSACGSDVPQIGGDEGTWCGLHLAEVVAAAGALGISLEDESGATDIANWNRACLSAYESAHS